MRRLITTGVLVLAIGFAGPFVLLPDLPGPDAPRVYAQEPTDGDLVRELAERLLAPPYGPPGSEQSVHLVPGSLPPELPVDLPVPDGGRVVGSAVRSEGNRTTSVDIVIDAPGSTSDALAFYQQTLTADGWYLPESARGGPSGGFQSNQNVSGGPYCQSEQGPWLSLSAFAMPQGGSDVRLSVNLEDGGPCWQQTGRPGLPPDSDRLPPLYPPAGVDLDTIGGNWSPGRISSEAVAQTRLSASRLEAHFAAQLRAAGWTRIDGRTDGPLAWSVWQVPGEGEWQGFLYALNGPGANQRSLYVSVASATPVDGPIPLPASISASAESARPMPAVVEPPAE